MGGMLAMLLAACATPAAPSRTQPAPAGVESTATPLTSPSPPGTPEGEPVTTQTVEIPEAGMSLEVPAGWARVEDTWAPVPGELPRVGVRWVDLQPPMEADAALLPAPAQVLSAEPIELSWGRGRRIQLEVYGATPAGAGGKAAVVSVETHVLIVVQRGAARRGYDIYLAARDGEQLEQLRPVLDAILASSRLGSSAGETGSGAAHPDWAAYTSQTYRVTLEYPATWQWVAGEEERHAGVDGFFLLAAVSGGASLDQVCDGEAHHVLQPYGSQPTIERAAVAGQEACWIFPSPDQPAGMNGQAALIVRYPQRVWLGQEPYEFVILWADQAHIQDMGATLGFLPGTE